MDDTYHLSAIILKREDFRENDSRVFVFSKEKGKLELVARGTKKTKSKLAGHLEPFNLVEIMAIRGRNFDYVGTALSSECFFDLKNDLEKLDKAGKAINVFNNSVKLNEATDALNLYVLLKKYLKNTNNSEKNQELLFCIFLLKLLVELGYAPMMETCSACGGTLGTEIFFSSASGGSVCANCLGNVESFTKISPEVADWIKKIIKNDLEFFSNSMIEQNVFRELDSIISDYFQYTSGGKI